jgi:hypothetical protein
MERVIVASTSTLPKCLQPMLATLTDGPFDDNDWIFEDKYDGHGGTAAAMSCSILAQIEIPIS